MDVLCCGSATTEGMVHVTLPKGHGDVDRAQLENNWESVGLVKVTELLASAALQDGLCQFIADMNVSRGMVQFTL